MKKQTINPEGVSTVALENLGEVSILVADLNAGKKHVIISEDVLDYLIDLLPKAHFRDIKDVFVDKVNQTQTMVEFTTILHEELNFHQSVNMIRKYYNKSEPVVATAVAQRPSHLD